MATTREYIIRPDGGIYRRTISEAEIEVTDQLMSIMVRDVTYKVANAFTLDKTGWVGLAITPGITYATVSLERLLIKAPWRLNNEGILTPNFGSKTDPVVSVRWTPPPRMGLRFIMHIIPGNRIGSTPRMRHHAVAFWLFAVDYRPVPPVFYRLPIANVHEDCSCCTGADNGQMGDTLIEAVRKSMDNFDQALYNADLWRNAELTQSMFRVKPIENGVFESIAPPGNWIDLCSKVGSNTTAFIV